MSTSKYPLVSIICPCFNPGENLSHLINSLLLQDYANKEIIIVDGGSTDSRTWEILHQYEQQIKLISGPDDGIYDAMNKGIEASKGDWLYFIGCDDSFHSAQVLTHIFSSPIPAGRDMVIGRAYFGKKLSSYRLSKKIFLENCILHQAAFYSRRVFNDFRYNKKFKVSSDYDLNFYCFKKGFIPHYVSTIICDFSLEGISSQVHYNSYSEEMAVRADYISSPFLRALCSLYSIARYIVRKCIYGLKK